MQMNFLVARLPRAGKSLATPKSKHVVALSTQVTGNNTISRNSYPIESWRLTRRSTRPALTSASRAMRTSTTDVGPAACNAARTVISSTIRSRTCVISTAISALRGSLVCVIVATSQSLHTFQQTVRQTTCAACASIQHGSVLTWFSFDVFHKWCCCVVVQFRRISRMVLFNMVQP